MKKHIMFSFDGGGSLGINSSIIYAEIEKKVKEKFKYAISNNQENLAKIIGEIENFKLSNFITFVSGTSTGSFNAAQVALNGSGAEMIEMFLNVKGRVFNEQKRTFLGIEFGGLWNSVFKRDGLDTIITKYCTAKNAGNIKEIDKLFMIPSFSLEKGKATLWTNCHIPNLYRDIDDVTYATDGLLSDALRASTALPIYLEGVTVQYNQEYSTEIDGGIFANNPINDALRLLEIHEETKEAMENLVLISIGTYKENIALNKDRVNNLKHGGVLEYIGKGYIFEVLHTSNDQLLLHSANTSVNEYGSKIFRFDPEIPSSLLDTTDDSFDHMKALKTYMENNYIPTIENQLNNAAEEIFSNILSNIQDVDI